MGESDLQAIKAIIEIIKSNTNVLKECSDIYSDIQNIMNDCGCYSLIKIKLALDKDHETSGLPPVGTVKMSIDSDHPFALPCQDLILAIQKVAPDGSIWRDLNGYKDGYDCDPETIDPAALIGIAKELEQKFFPKFDYYDEEYRKLRLQVFLRDGEVCVFCGAKPEPGLSLTIDHINPVSKFPELARDVNNLQVLCWDCNQKKSDKVMPVKKKIKKYSNKKIASSAAEDDNKEKGGYFFDELLKQL